MTGVVGVGVGGVTGAVGVGCWRYDKGSGCGVVAV